MPSAPHLSKHGRAYVSVVIVCGFAVVVSSIYQLTIHPVGMQWFLLAALTLVSGSATVKLPSVPASISISETFVCTAVLLYGPAAGTLTVALDGLVISYWISKRRQEPYRAFFNMSAPAVSAWCSAQMFFWLSGIKPLVSAPATLDRILPALLIFAIAYFSLNSWLIAVAISLEEHISAAKVWRENFLWLSLNYFCGASVAVLLVAGTRQVDWRFVGVIVPLLLVLYFTFKTSMERVEDANRHVEKVNRLYLSTIETLAMAIDAKDQVTHGHIRRVQHYAVGLARELGVRDDALIKAIEAAALLHDMGKLAVPEHILNKPGRLTDAEFAKMKLHASVGADILSAIDFPYPVVPIVRHHHESWDGSGYPNGLRGTEIPIGARILSVVDCFDALTSDRPYRPRLSDQEALDILNERKGTMYDPWVVQTFERVHATLDAASLLPAQTAQQPDDTRPVLAIAEINDGPSRRVTSQKVPVPAMPDVFTVINSVALNCEILLERLTSFTPSALSVFYRYDTRSDMLIARGTSSEAPSLTGNRMALGERLSGWVGANRRIILNSDASLDLGGVAARFNPRLNYCLSIPVVLDEFLVGVLSLYAPVPFTLEHEGLCNTLLEDIVSEAKKMSVTASLPTLRFRTVR